MSLNDKLKKIAAASAKQIPDESKEIMQASTNQVAATLASRSIPKAGDTLPAFNLPNSSGNIVKSDELALKGPFVLSFFRGKW